MKKTSESVVELETLNDAALEDVTGGVGQYIGGGFTSFGGGGQYIGGGFTSFGGAGGGVSGGGFTLRYALR